jgi:hypothetical protein
MKALTEAGLLGGSKLNLKGTGWKTDGTSRSMDGDEVASGTDCTVISGTRLTPSKSSARVLASFVRLGLAHCPPEVVRLQYGLQAFARERERACPLARPPARPPFPHGGPGPSFYRCKERIQVYNGGVAMR